MLPRPIVLHPEAVADARAAAQWYRDRSASAADAFLTELDRAMEKIAEAPEMSPRHVRGTRRFLMRHFPFSIIYRELSGKIEVIAIAHGRRKPRYWKDRLA
jgi:toxin ParE1/3/4